MKEYEELSGGLGPTVAYRAQRHLVRELVRDNAARLSVHGVGYPLYDLTMSGVSFLLPPDHNPGAVNDVVGIDIRLRRPARVALRRREPAGHAAHPRRAPPRDRLQRLGRVRGAPPRRLGGARRVVPRGQCAATYSSSVSACFDMLLMRIVSAAFSGMSPTRRATTQVAWMLREPSPSGRMTRR